MPSKASDASYHPFDVVIVPFPFTDRAQAKRRPALVLSHAQGFNAQSGHLVLAMITTAKASAWPQDVALRHSRESGLPEDCLVRMKLFTLDARLILKKAGSLKPGDRKNVQAALRKVLAL